MTQAHDSVDVDDTGRHVAPGGWRRALIGLFVGALAGAAIAFVLPRDDLPRRRTSGLEPWPEER